MSRPVASPPAGFEPMQSTCGFHELLGPFYVRRGDNFALGIHVSAKHVNPRHQLHGGAVCSVADMAIGYSMRSSAGISLNAATTSLTIHFVGSAAIGDWVEARVETAQRGGSVLFADCFLWLKGNRIAHASSSYLVLGGQEPAQG